MMSAWEVFINFTTRSNAGLVFGRLSAQAKAAQAQVAASAVGMNKSMSGIASGAGAATARMQGLAAVGRGLGVVYAGVGVALGAAMLQGIKGAGELQTALTTIQNATGATGKQLDMLRETAFNISAITAQSVPDSAKIIAVMAKASGGVFSPEQLAQVAPSAAKFADVQFLASGGKTSFEEAARWAILLAHQFREYDPTGTTKMFDTMSRLSMTMPHDLGKAVTQMSYFMPILKTMNVPDEQAVGLMSMMDRFSGGRRAARGSLT